MTLSHNGIVACEVTIAFNYIEFVYIRSVSGKKWLLYDSNLIEAQIHGVGLRHVPTNQTFGQQHVAEIVAGTYSRNAE
eukprot:6948414-Heterocapsa_arctica.AAC.1